MSAAAQRYEAELDRLVCQVERAYPAASAEFVCGWIVRQAHLPCVFSKLCGEHRKTTAQVIEDVHRVFGARAL